MATSSKAIAREEQTQRLDDFDMIMSEVFGTSPLVRAGAHTAPYKEQLHAFQYKGYPVLRVHFNHTNRKGTAYESVIDHKKLPHGFYYINMRMIREVESYIASAITMGPHELHRKTSISRMIKGIFEKSGLPAPSPENIMAMANDTRPMSLRMLRDSKSNEQTST